MKRSNQLNQVKKWESVKIGTPVIVKKDDGSLFATRTTSAAWMLGGHSAVIMVEGISGCYSLDRTQLIEGE